MGNAPGKSHRKGMTLLEVADMFPDNETARKWIEGLLWPDGPTCPHCGSFNVQAGIKHRSMTHRCRDCAKKPMFTVRVGSVMQDTKLSYREWAIAMYLYTTNIKGVSSMRLHRELGMTQKTAWFLAHRLRKAFETGQSLFNGPIEVDETFIGGKRKNMKHAKRRELRETHPGRGGVGKEIVAGAKDRETGKISAAVVPATDRETLHEFVADRAAEGTQVYTDEHGGYRDLPFPHETVNHSVGEYVDGMAHTNGIESFWAMFKRGYQGIYHKMSPKHLDRYVREFAGRHNIRDEDTIEQMRRVARGMSGKRLTYAELISDNGKESGARETA